MSFKTVSGESNACTDEMVAPWEQTTLPTILSKYDLNQIYNANEFGLLYRAQQIIPYMKIENENCRMKIALVVNTANFVWQCWQQLMQLEKNYPCL